MRTKWTKRVAVLVAMTVVVAACGGDDDSSSPDTTVAPEEPATTTAPDDSGDSSDTTEPASTEPATTEPEAPAEPGGVLRYVQPSEPATMNPVRSVIGDAAIWGTMFDRLVFVNDELELTGDGLITEWEAVEDTAWRMTLREGVQYHNGEAFNAEALKFTLDEYRLNPSGIMAGFFAGVTDVTVVDEFTLDIVSEAPNGAIPVLMATLYALPPGYYTEVGEDAFALAPMGTGPFVFGRYDPGIGVEVTANEDYWRGRPSLDGLQFSWAPDEATRAALLESGDADVVDALNVRSAARIAETDGLELVTVASLNGLPLFLVDTKPPFDDPIVREAVVRSVNRQAIVDSVFEGTGATATTGILSPLSPFVEAPDELYDPDRARELIASLPEVPVIPFSFQVGRQTGDGDVGEIVAGMLEEVGFVVERNPLEYAVLVGAAIAGEVEGMFNTSTRPVYLHPDVYANAFLSPTVSLTKSCKSEPRLDDLREQGVAELDLVAAGEIYSELDRLATSEVFCMMPLYVENRNYGMTDQVQGFKSRADTIPDWFFASLS